MGRETVVDGPLIVPLTRGAWAASSSQYGDISPYKACSLIGVRCSHVEAVMRVVVALGRDTLLHRGWPMTAEISAKTSGLRVTT